MFLTHLYSDRVAADSRNIAEDHPHPLSESLIQLQITGTSRAVMGTIEVQRMPQSSEAKEQTDDWTGKTDTALRRKLQNRLNQRAARGLSTSMRVCMTDHDPGRRGKETKKQASFDLEIVPVSSHQLLPSIPSSHITSAHPPVSTVGTSTSPIYRVLDISSLSTNRRIVTSAPSFSAFLRTPLPIDQQLLTLLHFNLIRALVTNVRILGLDPDTLETKSPSPFSSSSPSQLSSLLERLPPSLQPTELQLTVPHNGEYDGFPWRQFRDNAIRAGEMLDTDAFCRDMLYGVDSGNVFEEGVCLGDQGMGVGNGRTGLIVWADPWLESSWEVDEGFARKYAWSMRGCQGLMRSTNLRRVERGEQPLRIREFEEVEA